MGVGLWPETDDALVPASVFDACGVATRAHTEYQTDPIGWAHDKLGVPRFTLEWSLADGYDGYAWDGTPNPLAAAFQAISDSQDVAIESGTGTGKSYGVAILILWFLACFEDSEVYTFALNADQLKLFIWKNISELWPRFHAHFPAAELTSLCIRMRGGIDERWSAHGRPVQIRAGEAVATRAAGMHAPHMLLVYEESASMDPSILVAGKNTCTAPHNLRIAIGNPNHQLDTLHRMSQEAGVVAIRMSALDHPNVVSGNADLIPGACSRQSIDKRLADYGETSPVYQSRVRGISPEQASDALIRLEWLVASDARFQARKLLGTIPKRLTGLGVDVANSEHGDRGAVSAWYENACPAFEAFQCPDANVLGSDVWRLANTAGLEGKRVGVDAIGVGAGTVNEGRRCGMTFNALNAGGKPMRMIERAPDGKAVEWSGDVNVFNKLTSQMYWQAREDLRTGVIDVEKDVDLWRELTVRTFVDEPKTIVSDKDEVKVLLGHSPDKADAFVMGNWVRARAVPKPEKDSKFDKQPHKARPWVVDDQGHAVPHPKAPKTADELAERLTGGKQQNRTVFRRLVPRQREPR